MPLGGVLFVSAVCVAVYYKRLHWGVDRRCWRFQRALYDTSKDAWMES